MFGNKNKNEQRFHREFFTIFDSKTGIYREPRLSINKHDIMREIENLFKDPAHTKAQLVVNAEDFSIFKVGDYDSKTGEIRPTAAPEHIANLHDIRSAIARSAEITGH